MEPTDKTQKPPSDLLRSSAGETGQASPARGTGVEVHDGECELYSEACGCESRAELRRRLAAAEAVCEKVDEIRKKGHVPLPLPLHLGVELDIWRALNGRLND